LVNAVDYSTVNAGDKGAAPLELVINQAPNTVPVRVVLRKTLTTLGSDPKADVCLPMLPRQWAVVTRTGSGKVALRVLASNVEHVLDLDTHADIDGVSVAIASVRAASDSIGIAEIAASLANADTPENALAGLCRSVVVATGSDGGAVILREGGGFKVVIAQNADGTPMPRADALLSDTVVLDVLGGASLVAVGDLAGHSRYATVPSVVRLHLKSVLCVPMTVGASVLGAVFLGKRDARDPFSEGQARELGVLASMAIPFLAQMRRSAGSAGAEASLVGDCPAVREVVRLIARVGPSDLSVLVTGDTGTGKERTAHSVHQASGRGDRRLVALNCASVPDSLLEAELFGYKKGAFSGAVADRAGRIEDADGSTLFLDEIGDMPVAMQAALLRVLQEREVTRLGENQPRSVDFRLIAATHRDLDAEVAAGGFREDLLFRLREVTIALPPLRERGDDVILLAHLFLRQAEAQLSLSPHVLATSAERALAAHPWPGNVRELRAVMRRTAVLCDGAEITGADLALGQAPAMAAPAAVVADAGVLPAPLGDLARPLAEARDDFVSRYVSAVLDRCGGDRNKAAAELGISVRSLYRYL
jgi:transcriptional regulator with GAF, ATPase, and Fis domain